MIRIEGIRQTPNGWAVVGSKPGASVVPGRSPHVLVLVDEFTGPGSKARAIRAAGTNALVPDAARELIAALREAAALPPERQIAGVRD